MKKIFLSIPLFLVKKAPILLLPIYWITFLIPRRKNIWVFGSSFGKSFSGNPKYLYLYSNFIEDSIRSIWISEDDKIVLNLKKEGYESYNIYSLKGLVYSLIAGTYIFDHYSKDICFWTSGGARKVNLWHGIPLKKGHRDNKFDVVRNPKNMYDKFIWTFRRIQNEKPTHYYSVTSEFIKKLHVRAFAADSSRVYVSGYPRNDIFFDQKHLNFDNNLLISDMELKTKVIEEKNKGNKIVMYMPTFRESETEFFEVMNLDKFNEILVKKKVIMLVKVHHLSKLAEEFEEISYSNIVPVKSTEDPYPFLKISDALITDYSSVYFDYLLTDRPVIFFDYDLEVYMSQSRELYYEYEDITPGTKAKNMEELVEAIKNAVENNDKHKEYRKRVRDKMFDYIDGKSSERLYGILKRGV